MKINADIGVLGSITDFQFVIDYIKATTKQNGDINNFQAYSNIKTTQSFKRYERAFKSTLLKFKSADLEILVKNVLMVDGITPNSLLLLFWNASGNNEFLHMLNYKVLFPAFYSGRISINKEEVTACIKEMREKELTIQKWTDSTIQIAARKYIAFLSRINIMEGGRNKTISTRYLDDKTFLVFIYWLLAIEIKPNILKSQWLQYAFMEKEVFVDRIIQKQFRKYISFQYSGDNLKIEPVINYEELHDKLA